MNAIRGGGAGHVALLSFYLDGRGWVVVRDRRGRCDLPTSARRREVPGNTAGRTPRRGCHPGTRVGRGLLPLYTHACGGEVAAGHAAPLTPAHGPSGDTPALIRRTNQPARHGRWRGRGTETARRRVCITAPSPTALDAQHAHPPGPGTCRRRRKCVVSTPRGEFGVDRHRGSQRAARPQTTPACCLHATCCGCSGLAQDGPDNT